MMLTIIEEASGYCGKCLKQVPVRRTKVRHLMHLMFCLLSVFWVVMWVRQTRKVRQWRCMKCGTVVYKIMQPIE